MNHLEHFSTIIFTLSNKSPKPLLVSLFSLLLFSASFEVQATCYTECVIAQNEACEIGNPSPFELNQCRNRAYDYCQWYCEEGGGRNSFISRFDKFQDVIDNKGIKPDVSLGTKKPDK